MSKFQCPMCSVKCSSAFNLRQHRKIKHEPHSESEKAGRTCELCFRLFGTKSNLKRHLKLMHTSNDANAPQILKFNCLVDFKEWKMRTERDTKAQFVKHSSTTVNKNGTARDRYYCHRSGMFKSRGKKVRRMKLPGSNKINGKCPSKIKCIVNPDGSVVASFWPKHEGHSMDLERTYLTKNERANIAEKISAKIPFNEILKSIRDSKTESDLSRVHLLTRKDLYNIERDFSLNNKLTRHSNVCVNLHSWVNEEKIKDSNIVKFYKSEGSVLEEHTELRAEDFVLIIMNNAQAEHLQRYGNDCICIDGTHGLTSYNFEMHTLLVLDDLREGFPCAFMFSNRNDTCVFELFFSIIKTNLLSTVSPKVFMSDVADTYYNAWCSVMKPASMRLYCNWHVDKSWRLYLSKIKNEEIQIQLYTKLRALLEETDITSFEIMCNNFFEEIKFNKETNEFATYFEKYMHNASAWAVCYRVNSELNTNMPLERMHRTIKFIYSKGKSLRHLDKAILSIMQFVRDKLFERCITLPKSKLTSKISQIRPRHKAAMEMTNIEIMEAGEQEWDMVSLRTKENYRITKLNIDCSCSLRCEDCSVCIHGYSCSCIDNCIKWNMCKHIHWFCINMKENGLVTCYEVEDNLDRSPLGSHPPDLETVNILTLSTNRNTEENLLLEVNKSEMRGIIEQMNQMVDCLENEEQAVAMKDSLGLCCSLIQSIITKK